MPSDPFKRHLKEIIADLDRKQFEAARAGNFKIDLVTKIPDHPITYSNVEIDQVRVSQERMYQMLFNTIPRPAYTKEQEKKMTGYAYDEQVAVDSADNKLHAELAEKLAEAKLQAKRDALASIGDEPTDTKYVAFSKKFESDGISYDYVAIRTPKGWFTSASRGGGMTFGTWGEMVLWLVKGPFPTDTVTPLFPASA